MSIVSMTGFGRGTAHRKDINVQVELSAVNRKQLDMVMALPKNLQVLEARIQEVIRKHLQRGRITCSVAVSMASGPANSRKALQVDQALAKEMMAELEALCAKLDVPFNPTAENLLRLPDVFVLSEPVADIESWWPLVKKALLAAIRELIEMREQEGAALLKDLRKRLATLKRHVTAIEKRSGHSAAAHRTRLHERLNKAGLPIDLNDERLLKEVAIFAEKSDFTEEIIRLDSHLEQFDEKLAVRGAVGRALDFLCQEIFREISTLGVKASDAEIAQRVVDFKAELEKLREQVQNVE